MDEVFQADRSEGEHHNANRMTSPPSQPSAQGSDGLSQGKRRHRHEMVRTTHHMDSTSGETREQADQQKLSAIDRNSAGRGNITPPPVNEGPAPHPPDALRPHRPKQPQRQRPEPDQDRNA